MWVATKLELQAVSVGIDGPDGAGPGGEADPAGRGRRRSVTTEHVGRSEVRGGTVWGEGEPREKGEVRVETSMSKVTLDLSRID